MRLVLVNGAQRSGTTMLASMLGNAPGSIVLPDSGMLSRLVMLEESGRLSAAAVRRELLAMPRLRRWPYAFDDLMKVELPFSAPARKHVEAIATHLAALDGNSSPDLMISHEPTDIFRLDQIVRQFDDLALVNLVRDGRAVASSLYRVPWGPRTLRGSARSWERQVLFGLGAIAIAGGRISCMTEARFEQIVEDPGRSIRRICDEVGLPVQPTMWTAGAFKPLEFSLNDHQLVGAPPAAGRTDAWMAELSTSEVTMIEREVGDLLRHLDYPLITNRRPSTVRLLSASSRSLIGASSHRVRERFLRSDVVLRVRRDR